ncbi:hypothetical protein CFP66_12550 [Pseudonocardia sp. MH-G8]|nr:hypothetical protein CFP66_12550 [Pseudonocardia sp. MH-G8]
MWLRITLLLAIAGWSIYAAFRWEDRMLRRITRAARGSVRRALLVTTAGYLALVAVLALFGLAGAIAHGAGLSSLTVLVLLIGLATTAPFLWLLAPAGESGGPATSFRDLRRKGAKPGVARAIAYTAVVHHFLLLVPAMSATAIAVVVIE